MLSVLGPGAQTSVAFRYTVSLIDAVHGDAAEKLRKKVGGLLGHDFAGGSDTHDLIDVDRIKKEGDLSGAAVDSIESGGSFAFVRKISFGGDGLRRNAERGLENSVMEKHDVQSTLKGRNGMKKLG